MAPINVDEMANNTTSLAASLTSTAEQRNRRYRSESNVKFDLSKLIDALGYGPVEKIATKTVNEELKAAPGKGQVALSKTVRNALADAGVDAAMDACARELLPDHAE